MYYNVIIILIILCSCTSKKKYNEEYFPDGKLKASGYKIDTLKTGEWILYYGSGDTAFVESYRHGKLHGERIYYHHSGYIKSIKNYVNGIKEGHSLSYHPNGNLHTSGNNVKWKTHGDWKQYSDNGKVQVEAIFEMDTPKFMRYYYENGVIAWETSDYVNGEIQHYDSLGNITFKVIMHNLTAVDTVVNNH